MPIYRLLQNSAFGPEEIGRMTAAFDDALHVLGLPDRESPTAEIVAKKIVEVSQTGERDPRRIRMLALQALGMPAVIAESGPPLPDSSAGRRRAGSTSCA